MPAIAVDPSDSQHVLLGAAAGGVWQTRDGGQSWMPVTDDQPTLSIGALAFDPLDPSKVYAGTGEGKVTSLSYAYLLAATFVSATAFSLSLIAAAPLTRRGLDAETAADSN